MEVDNAFCSICDGLIKGIVPVLPSLERELCYEIHLTAPVRKCPVYKVLWLTGKTKDCVVCGFLQTVFERICHLERRRLANMNRPADHYNIPFMPPLPVGIRKDRVKKDDNKDAAETKTFA